MDVNWPNLATDIQISVQTETDLLKSDPNVGGWQGNQGGPQQSLSVVTTVWGVTPTTQTVPYNHTTPSGYNAHTNTTMSSTNYTQPPQGFPGNQMQKPGYENPMYQRSNSYPCPSGYPPTPNTPGSTTPISATQQKNDYHAPPAALSAAALVAAAATATATATATASMVALQEQQNQQQQLDMQMGMGNQYGPQMQMPPGQQPAPQYGNQYGGMPQRHPNPMGMGRGPGPGPGPMKNNMMAMYQRRANSAPYMNPQQMMQAKRSQYPNGTQYGPQGPYQQYPNKPQYPAQQPLPSPTYGPQPGMRPNGPYANGQNPYMNQGQFPPTRQNPNGQGYNFNSSPNQQTFQPNPNMNYPHSPLPGNPTPPITPNNVPPYPADVKPNICGPIKKDIDELRLTFPVRDGVVLPPFRLEHNLAVSNHVFHLRESVYQTLMWRSDLELQLKCFHHEDRQMNTNWPASVTVSVNATPLHIERGENKTSHRPLYLKEVCRPGRNTIQITVTACCCSHLFVLQLVHRPSVRSVLTGLLKKRLLPAEHCITKIKRNFTNSATSNSALNDDGVEQTAIKVSLKCPISFRRITLPARGHDCKHIQCFDLEGYLQMNCDRGRWLCPVCNKGALLEGLEIDQYIWGVLTNLANTEFEEVTIDATASWKPVQIKSTIKEEEGTAEPCARWMKAMSPHSMQMPTMNNWDMGNPNSPYSMPPSSQGPPFSGSYGGPGANGGTNFPPNGGPQGDFPANMLPMSPGANLNNITMNNINSPDMMNRPLSHPGQYPLSPPESTTHLRHPPDQGMANNSLSSSNQSLATSNHNSANGMPPQQQSQSNNSISSPQQQQQQQSQQNSVGDDLNFDPTAIIDGDAASAGLELDSLTASLGDPIELLSYLGPSEPGDNNSSNNNTSGNQSNNNSNTNNNEDILSFFES